MTHEDRASYLISEEENALEARAPRGASRADGPIMGYPECAKCHHTEGMHNRFTQPSCVYNWARNFGEDACDCRGYEPQQGDDDVQQPTPTIPSRAADCAGCPNAAPPVDSTFSVTTPVGDRVLLDIALEILRDREAEYKRRFYHLDAGSHEERRALDLLRPAGQAIVALSELREAEEGQG